MLNKIKNFMGLTVLERDKEEGLYFNPDLQEKLSEAIDAAQANATALAEAQARVAELTAQIESNAAAVSEAEAAAATAAEEAANAHAEEIANLNASHEAAIAALTAERDNAQAELATANENLATANERIAQLETQQPAAPTPAAPSASNEEDKKDWADMTLAEKKAAWSK